VKFKAKIVLALFFGTFISIIIVGSALAGPSISGNSQVYPGGTYTYTIKVTETATSISGTAKTSGILGSQTKNWKKDSDTGYNQSLTASTSITVTIPSSAAIGATGTITVDGNGSKLDPDTNLYSNFDITGSKTITVVAPPVSPSPEAWELAVKEIKEVEEGGSITFEMNPEDSKEINVPIEVFEAVKEGKVILTIDYSSFTCTIDGNTIGDIPPDVSEVNVGIALQPIERADDMIVFDLNYTSQLFYVATYALQPFVDPQEDLIYVYRNYQNINVLEYVNDAQIDNDGNVLIRVFAPGSYIVSATSITGSEGNMDVDAFIELFATPTPEPTSLPTPTPTSTHMPTPITEPVVEETNRVSPSIWILGGVLLALLAVFMVALVIGIRNQNKRQRP